MIHRKTPLELTAHPSTSCRDFVILDGDYMKVPEEKISDLKAIMTVIDGKVVYEVPGQF